MQGPADDSSPPPASAGLRKNLFGKRSGGVNDEQNKNLFNFEAYLFITSTHQRVTWDLLLGSTCKVYS